MVSERTTWFGAAQLRFAQGNSSRKYRWVGVSCCAALHVTHFGKLCREAIQFGQRIDTVEIERWQPEGWQPVAKATGIGARRLIRLDAPIIAQRLRLRITQASASPALSEFALFGEAGS